MAVKDPVLSKETFKHKHGDTKKIEYLENNISEDHSKEIYIGKMFNLIVPFLKKKCFKFTLFLTNTLKFHKKLSFVKNVGMLYFKSLVFILFNCVLILCM